MGKKRCQVCDGPIANGRCRYCGMPYRNDEVLYHLNESRSDHYRHASEKAKVVMRQQQNPYGDKKAEQKKTASKEEIKARQQQVRDDAMKRMTDTRVPVSQKYKTNGSGSVRSQKKTYTSSVNTYTTQKSKQKKKRSPGKILAWIIILAAFIPNILGVVIEFVQDEVLSNYSYNTYQKIDDGYYLKAFLNEGEMVLVDDDLDAGTYVVYIEEGYATIVVGNAEDFVEYDLAAGSNMVEVTVEDGDAIAVESADSKYTYVDIYYRSE